MSETHPAPRLQHPRCHWIAGEWAGAASGKTLTVTSPSTGADLGEVAEGDAADAARAVEAAKAAAPKLAAMTAFERGRACQRIADAIERRVEALARMLTLEQGKPYHAEALVEAREAAECFRLWGEEAGRLTGVVYPSADPHKRILTLRQPRGVYALVTPWNWPLTMPAELIAPALAAGNSVAWVPAPTTSLCAGLLAECIAEGELPKGAVNLVTGLGPVVGDAVVSHPDVGGVAFIGSIATGRKIAERAAGKPLLLELGGNGPFIVCADADLDRAAQGAAYGAFLCAGQSCAAAGRVLVNQAVAAPFTERLVAHAQALKLGDPFDPTTTMGPLNNAALADKVERHVKTAVEAGARLLTGGQRRAGMPTSLYFEPTVLDRVPPTAEIFREETFGPVAPVSAFSSEAELQGLTAGGPYGLVAAVYTRDFSRAFRLAEGLKSGVVNVNESTNYWELHAPYGGVKGSGVGRIGGRWSLEEMTEVKTVVVDTR